MATLLLTAVGTMVGGPLGGAVGALAGRSIDGAIMGRGTREGPRLRELAVTTSSYGQPIPRHHGRMRAAGTIVWATELTEHRERTGGKKGQPSVTSYAYSASFAVALSSRPIEGIGRIWADGNLLRGEAGDLKAAGAMRLYTGHGDQPPDRLIAADKGDLCPAFRGCAYVVFEDLALADFGNRIPALTFEIVADAGPVTLADLVGSADVDADDAEALPALSGFANEGGPIAATLDTIDALYPLAIDAGGTRLTVEAARTSSAAPILLPEAARAWEDADFGAGAGHRQGRDLDARERVDGVRYYDRARDYQPGVQRTAGRAHTSGGARLIEFPGALTADAARGLAEAAARRARGRRERMQWRVAELDPAVAPGAQVRVPGKTGVWRVEGWEWRDRGIELDLVRCGQGSPAGPAGDAGAHPAPADVLPGPTVLRVFELPPSSLAAAEPALFAAATSPGAWSGAALFVERADELVPIGQAGRRGSTIGRLAAPLPPSQAVLFEPEAAMEIVLSGREAGFASVSLAALLAGANRLLVGDEVVQFARAQQVGADTWRLSGLLRGRGGTEHAALAGHGAGAAAILLDDAPIPLDPALASDRGASVYAAIGRGDSEPVMATRTGSGAALRPPCPVHPLVLHEADGGLALSWTRRARGAWTWSELVDVPLVEDSERYEVGLGPVDGPHAVWPTAAPRLHLGGDTARALRSTHPGAPLWVRQVGTWLHSPPLLLAYL